MKTLNQYIKQVAQKEIIESFDEIYKIAIESNRNREWWDSFKVMKVEALNRDLKGEELEKFIAPLYNTLNDDSLKSALTKEERDKNKEIWDNEELKIKRESHKSQLNLRFKKFFSEARKAYCNDEFIEQIANRRFECYKQAFGLKEIDKEIDALRGVMLESHNQLNPNQKQTKDKFDKVINDLIKAQEENEITINAFNSGDYNDKNSSLWTQIFALEKGAIKDDVNQEIVDMIIADCERIGKETIKRIAHNKEVAKAKKAVNEEARQIYIDELNDRQRLIFMAFDEILIQYQGKHNKAFWDEVIKPLKEMALAMESSDEELHRFFAEIETKSKDAKYAKKDTQSA